MLVAHVNCAQWERDYNGAWHTTAALLTFASPEMIDGHLTMTYWDQSFSNVVMQESVALDDRCWYAQKGGVDK